MILPALSQQCLDAFVLLNNQLPPDREAQKQSLANSFGSYRAWIGNAQPVAVQDSTSHLEELLRDDEGLHSRVVRLLTKLSLLLADALQNEDDDSDTDTDIDGSVDSDAIEKAGTKEPSVNQESVETKLNRALERIHATIENLFRLSDALHLPTRHDQLVHGDLIAPEDFRIHDLQQVKALFPRANTILVERLAAGITRRRQYFQYRANRFAGSGDHDGDGWTEGSKVDTAGPVVESANVIMPFDVTPGQVLVPRLSRVDDSGSGPGLECPICYGQYWTRDLEFWKSHISDDMLPYMCTLETCSVPFRMYPNSRAWQHHEESIHYRRWRCPFDCHSSFDLEALLEDHLVAAHQVSEDPETLQIIAQASSQQCDKLDYCCPLCEGSQQSASAWYSHVGEHLQRLSLFSLPQHLTEVLNDEDEDDENEDDSVDEDDGHKAEISQDGFDAAAAEVSQEDSLEDVGDVALKLNNVNPETRPPARGALSTIFEEPSVFESGDWNGDAEKMSESSSDKFSVTRFFDTRQHDLEPAVPNQVKVENLERFQSNLRISSSEQVRQVEAPMRKKYRDPLAERHTHESFIGSQQRPTVNDNSQRVSAQQTSSEQDWVHLDDKDRPIMPDDRPWPKARTLRGDQPSSKSSDIIGSADATADHHGRGDSILNHLSIKLSLAPGYSYKIPFQVARTWEGMLQTVKEAYRYSPNHTQLISDDRFDLLDSEGSTVLPSLWQYTIRPGTDFSIRFDHTSHGDIARRHRDQYFGQQGTPAGWGQYPTMREPVIPLGVPFGGEPIPKSTKGGKGKRRSAEDEQRKDRTFSDDSQTTHAPATKGRDHHSPLRAPDRSPRLLDHQYKENDSDGYYPNLTEATAGAYGKPPPRRQVTDDLASIMGRIEILEDHSEHNSKQRLIQPPLSAWHSPSVYGGSVRDSWNGSARPTNARASVESSTAVRFADPGVDKTTFKNSVRSPSGPPRSSAPGQREPRRSGLSRASTFTESGAGDYSNAIIEDSTGRRIVHLTREQQAELIRRHQKQRLEETQLLSDRSDAYQKSGAGREVNFELSAENVKNENRKSGSKDPPSYTEVGSNTLAEVGSTSMDHVETHRDDPKDGQTSSSRSGKLKKKDKQATKGGTGAELEIVADDVVPSSSTGNANSSPFDFSSDTYRDPAAASKKGKRPEAATVSIPTNEDEEPD